MGMLSILLGVLMQIFVSVLDVQLESESTSSIDQDSRYILSRFMYDINRADKTIILPVNLGDTTSTLEIKIDNINYNYNLDAGNLEVTDDTGTYTLNSFDTTISNLTFQKLGILEGTNTIRINFTITGKTIKPGGVETKSFQTTVGTR